MGRDTGVGGAGWGGGVGLGEVLEWDWMSCLSVAVWGGGVGLGKGYVRVSGQGTFYRVGNSLSTQTSYPEEDL